MSDYSELVKALRRCGNVNTDCDICPWDKYNFGLCEEKLHTDAADAIEELQALYRQMDKRNTDLHNEGYDVGYWAGKRDAEAAQPHWVSVEERLPDTNIDVLVMDNDGDMQVAWMDKYNSFRDKYSFFFDGVAYWMPLPEPPQEVQDGSSR